MRAEYIAQRKRQVRLRENFAGSAAMMVV